MADDVPSYVKQFEENGYAVIENVLTPEECEQSIQEIWYYLTNKNPAIDRDDWKTWGNENWPREICRNGGFVGTFPYWRKIDASGLKDRHISVDIMAWKNRQNPKIYEAFKNIMKTERLWVSVDRYGIMRPTKLNFETTNIPSQENINTETSKSSHEDSTNKPRSMIKDDWKTKENWLHWDLSPFHYGTSAAGFAPAGVHYKELAKNYGGLRVQGLVTLTDCPEEVGGFHCVKGFTDEKFFKWGEDNREYGSQPDIKARNFIEVPEDDPMRANITRVPMKAGSLLIWNSQLPHGNFPNVSDKFRMVQYVKMISVDEPREFKPAVQYEKLESKEFFPPDFEPTELGKKLFGLENW